MIVIRIAFFYAGSTYEYFALQFQHENNAHVDMHGCNLKSLWDGRSPMLVWQWVNSEDKSIAMILMVPTQNTLPFETRYIENVAPVLPVVVL